MPYPLCKPLRTTLLGALMCSYAATTMARPILWGELTTPVSGAPLIYGGYTSGCIAGAEALPLIGLGFQVMRPSRNRYFGHPALTAFIRHFGELSAQRGERLLIGDLSQPRGGPMRYGHASHQNGLDVDIWFERIPLARTLSVREVETKPLRSTILAPAGRIDPAHWNTRHSEFLRLAASAPAVERIFVNPVIKARLCATTGAQRSWLGKLRPWWGHDDHYHVRLACPPGAANCEAQPPTPAGDGCNEDLAGWIREVMTVTDGAHPAPARHGNRALPAGLPLACNAVLRAPTPRILQAAE